jgi:hypothetical protein
VPDRYEELPRWAREEIELMKRGLCWHCGQPPYTVFPKPAEPFCEPVIESVESALGPIPPRVLRLLETAQEHGWQEGKAGTTVVMRLHKPSDIAAIPFYVSWLLTVKDGKRSWRFQGSRAANGQPLAWNDIKTYLQDPSVIYPEPPEGTENEQATDTRAAGQIDSTR